MKREESQDLNCTEGERSATQPQSVHRLRAGDVDTVAALGDSNTVRCCHMQEIKRLHPKVEPCKKKREKGEFRMPVFVPNMKNPNACLHAQFNTQIPPTKEDSRSISFFRPLMEQKRQQLVIVPTNTEESLGGTTEKPFLQNPRKTLHKNRSSSKMNSQNCYITKCALFCSIGADRNLDAGVTTLPSKWTDWNCRVYKDAEFATKTETPHDADPSFGFQTFFRNSIHCCMAGQLAFLAQMTEHHDLTLLFLEAKLCKFNQLNQSETAQMVPRLLGQKQKHPKFIKHNSKNPIALSHKNAAWRCLVWNYWNASLHKDSSPDFPAPTEYPSFCVEKLRWELTHSGTPSSLPEPWTKKNISLVDQQKILAV